MPLLRPLLVFLLLCAACAGDLQSLDSAMGEALIKGEVVRPKNPDALTTAALWFGVGRFSLSAKDGEPWGSPALSVQR